MSAEAGRTPDLSLQVVVVGAGPAGLGCAALLLQMQLPPEDLLVIEQGEVGETFLRWPKEMRFITPSFPSNGFHQTDLNAITPDTSPAFSLGAEHPTGAQYASYLRSVVAHYKLPVAEREAIVEVEPGPEHYLLTTSQGRLVQCRFLIWAAGEFQSPAIPDFPGAEHCVHNSRVRSYVEQPGQRRIIIGGYESGIDAAWHWVNAGKQVTLLEGRPEKADTWDPSRVLSPVSQERLALLQHFPLFELHCGCEVTEVVRTADNYVVHCTNGHQWESGEPPLLCTGFETHLGPVTGLFATDEQGMPFTNTFDESTLVPRLFLTGPRLSYGEVLLCFIYKFRGRFPVVCATISAELGLDTKILEHYLQAGMLLDDLSCCEGQQCFC